MKLSLSKSYVARAFTLFVLGTLLFPNFALAVAGIKLPQDKIPAVPTSDAAIRTKVVGLTIAGQTVQGLTLDSLATAFVRGLLTELTNQTVKWINSGFQGGPQYAVDLKNYLKNEADATAGYVIGKEVPGLCSPFQDVVKLALIDAQAANTQSSAVQSSCTFSQVSDNIQNFMNGDFVGSGGYPAWFEMTQDPYGNPYSSFLNVQASVDVNTEAALTNQTTQLAWNRGFLSTEKCTAQNSDGSCSNYSVQTPGSVIANQLDKIIGSQTDELNLSTDFNDIILALTGELQNIIFNSAKGIFDKNPYSNTYAGGGVTGGNGASPSACSASADTYIIGDPSGITWSYGGVTGDTSTNGSQSFVWSGNDMNATTSPNPTLFYTTEGTKSASVTIKQSLDGGLSTTTTTESCSDQVIVSKYPPLQLTCSLADPIGNPLPGHIQPGSLVIWTMQLKGGSGLLNAININEGATLNVTSDNSGKNFGPDSPKQWNLTAGTGAPDLFTPLPLNADFTAFSGGNNPQFIFAGDPLPITRDANNVITFTIPVVYNQTGSWPMKFDEIVDHDPNVPIYTGASCGQTVTVNPN